MKFKKIASSIFAILLITGATTSNSRLISKVAANNAITAQAASSELISNETTLKWNYDNKYIDSTGNWEIRLDDNASMAQICALIEPSLIQSGKKLYIPAYVTVTLTDSSNKEYYHTVPVTSIGSCVFCDRTISKERAKSLTDVDIPSTVIEILDASFWGTGIYSLTIPSSVNVIRENAFKFCENLTNVNFDGKTPSILSFSHCPNLKTFNNQDILSYDDETGQPLLYESVLNELYNSTDREYKVSECSIVEQYMDSYIEYIAKQCVSRTDGSPIQIAREIHDWLIKNTEYDYDFEQCSYTKYAPFFHKPNGSKCSYAVCAGYAEAYQDLMEAANIECGLVQGDNKITKEGDHEWNWIEIDDKAYQIDVCWDDRGDEISYNNFMRSKAIMENTHNYSIRVIGLNNKPSYDAHELGKIDFDDDITQNDAIMVRQYVLGLITLEPEKVVAADVNFDGKVNMADAFLIAQVANKKGANQSFFEYMYLS
ncbi:MAG TPA: leucine-rich repeat protein [Ruminococcus flavefaciens]|nr:leucine-rich repeat protein [Ruminococcus flavefaciens]